MLTPKTTRRRKRRPAPLLHGHLTPLKATAATSYLRKLAKEHQMEQEGPRRQRALPAAARAQLPVKKTARALWREQHMTKITQEDIAAMTSGGHRKQGL